ncbi:MAG: hypothetical protein ACTHJM_07530 [Marmoricola sp.]
MIALGVLLLILGLITGIGVLWSIGVIVLIVGLVLAVLGAFGRPLGPRSHYW